ncbi:TrmH family RNA methyltransferase [Rhabdochlamydiaceae symbiont of Dictyostelium giganteum]|uniref:TrmH family RNA methyltransferase n=1 Tax=Rhabdochlamydiaceae symbiont of Dictyostelium giganteum TaxID=3342349 RepID=UPI00384A49F0
MNKLTSSQNMRVKNILHLREKRERDKTSLFLIEGYREIERAVSSGVVFESFYYCPPFFLGSNEEKLIDQIKAPLFELSEELFKKVSYRDRPDGLLGVAYQMKTTLQDLKQKENALYVIAEAIEKPGNLGTILRSSDAVGADGVIVCDRCTDIYNPNVVRASVGTLFTLPVIESSSQEVFEWLKKEKIQTVATTPFASLNYTDANLLSSVAIVVGTEQLGLSDFWLNSADISVSIPMKGIADSLNVATATTLLLYEVLRQRRYSIL